MSLGNFDTHGNMSPDAALIQGALKDLNTALKDAPESGGGPNWDKRQALSKMSQISSLFTDKEG
ncbi:hypothetical protein ABT096_32390 [Streptomyces sp. NPDC002561]|uniref:hypothetical protein n=1 Tax=Streptomyces sp. NPDC002561 TaxID=3154418 RepID=UPI0033348952